MRGDKLFSLTAGCTITNGYSLYLVLLYQADEFARGARIVRLGRMRIDGLIVQQVALCIQTHHLTAGTVAGVNGEHALLPERGCKEQLLEVGSNMGFFPPPGMFPGDSAMMGGQGFPPFPPGMFPGDSAAMADMDFPPFSPDMFPGGADMDAQGFPPFSPGVFPGGGAGMPEGFEFPPKGNFPPPMPMRRIVSDFSEDNLPNYDER